MVSLHPRNRRARLQRRQGSATAAAAGRPTWSAASRACWSTR